MPFGQHTRDLIPHALTRNLMNLRGQLLNSAECRGINRVIKPRREPHGTQHSQFIFRKSQSGIADCTDNLRFQVVLTTHKVQNSVLDRIEKQTVDGEIPSLNVFFRIAAEADLVGMASIAIADIATECCNLDYRLVTSQGIAVRAR